MRPTGGTRTRRERPAHSRRPSAGQQPAWGRGRAEAARLRQRCATPGALQARAALRGREDRRAAPQNTPGRAVTAVSHAPVINRYNTLQQAGDDCGRKFCRTHSDFDFSCVLRSSRTSTQVLSLWQQQVSAAPLLSTACAVSAFLVRNEDTDPAALSRSSLSCSGARYVLHQQPTEAVSLPPTQFLVHRAFFARVLQQPLRVQPWPPPPAVCTRRGIRRWTTW